MNEETKLQFELLKHQDLPGHYKKDPPRNACSFTGQVGKSELMSPARTVRALPVSGVPSAGMVSIRVVPWIVKAKSAPDAAAGLSAPRGDRVKVSSTARMPAAAVKA